MLYRFQDSLKELLADWLQSFGSKQNNYNLSVSTYVEQEDTREKIDIVKLNAEIAEIVAREQKLREEIDRIIGEIEG